MLEAIEEREEDLVGMELDRGDRRSGEFKKAEIRDCLSLCMMDQHTDGGYGSKSKALQVQEP